MLGGQVKSSRTNVNDGELDGDAYTRTISRTNLNGGNLEKA